MIKIFKQEYRIKENRWCHVTAEGDTAITQKFYPQMRNVYFGIGIWDYVIGFRPWKNDEKSFPTAEKCEAFLRKWKNEISPGSKVYPIDL